MKYILFLNALFSLILIPACQPANTNTPLVTIHNHSFIVEIADEPAEWTQGLMYRTSLPQNHGMLFDFGKEAPRNFWMKNTKIPLDMIFIGENKQIVQITTQAQPCTSEPCQTYSSPPARYVLEINAGFSKETHMGDIVMIQT